MYIRHTNKWVSVYQVHSTRFYMTTWVCIVPTIWQLQVLYVQCILLYKGSLWGWTRYYSVPNTYIGNTYVIKLWQILEKIGVFTTNIWYEDNASCCKMFKDKWGRCNYWLISSLTHYIVVINMVVWTSLARWHYRGSAMSDNMFIQSEAFLTAESILHGALWTATYAFTSVHDMNPIYFG